MRRTSSLLVFLIVNAVLLQAQKPGGGLLGRSGSIGTSYVSIAPSSTAHSSGGQGHRTVITGGLFPGRIDGFRHGRPRGRGFGSFWLPWPYPYWGDNYYDDDSVYLQPVNAPPQTAPPVIEYREPERPARPPESPKVIEVNLSKETATTKPLLPTVFLLTDGEKLESHEYLLTASSLRIDLRGVQRTIPFNNINVDATLAANHERGIDLTFPRNSGTIFLGF